MLGKFHPNLKENREMAYTDVDAAEIAVIQSRLLEIHRNLGRICEVLADMGPGSTVTLQLSSFNVYLPRLEILTLNSVAKASTDAIQAKYRIKYPERDQKIPNEYKGKEPDESDDASGSGAKPKKPTPKKPAPKKATKK